MIKDSVRDSGGSLSHHHGIGKKNSYKYGKIISSVSKDLLKVMKHKVDPKNIFAAGNLVYNEDEQKSLVAKL